MEPLIQSSIKRPVAVLIPYRKFDEWEFYLQKRDANAPVHPNIFSMFGGGIKEGETVEGALKRELLAELEYAPTAPKYFCKFETSRAIFHVFMEEVSVNFESGVTIHEGEYGKFLRFDDIDCSKEVSDIAQMITRALIHFLSK